MNWISVKDRLPEESGMYLVYCTGKDKRYNCVVVEYASVHRAFNARDDYPPLMALSNVTHWMPLPEPPKEDMH